MKKALAVLSLTFAALLTYAVASNDIKPGGHHHIAFGQTGPTGPTGPTGALGTINNHTYMGGSAPTVSACGTSPTLVTGSVDNGGTINVGTTTVPGGVLNCTVTFATAFTNVPAFTVSTNTRNTKAAISQLSTTRAILVFSSDMAGQKVGYFFK